MFDLSDLLWGTLNHFKDTRANNSGDPRRDNSQDFINLALNKAYGRDTLESITGFYGIVIQAFDTYQIDHSQKDSLLSDYAVGKVEGYTDMRTAYKVYIPEIEPSPAPTSATDPVLWFYPNIFPTAALRDEVFSPGDLVRVEYQDMQNLIGPTIVSKEGAIHLAYPSAKTGGLPFKFKQAESKALMLDTGEFSWSNRAKQKTSLYIPSNKTLGNGDLEQSGILEINDETGARLLPGAMADFKLMNEAFKKKFGHPLQQTGGYRDYQAQVRERMRRVLGDQHGCPAKATGDRAEVQSNGKLGEGIGQWTYEDGACKWIGYAAIPGTSAHGWGGAVDLGGLSTGQFEWLNKFGLPKWNFVFGVLGEKWHISWTGLKDVLQSPPTQGFARWNQDGVTDEGITLA